VKNKDSKKEAGNDGVAYAGLKKRFLAFLIDWAILFGGVMVIGLIVGFGFAASGSDLDTVSQNSTNFFIGIIGWLYYAFMESSEKQATFGKAALGVKVTDYKGERITFGRATGRHFGKIISWFSFLVGFIMIGFTEKKQGLHDILAKCLVVKA